MEKYVYPPPHSSLRDEIALACLQGMHVNALGVKNLGDVKSDQFLDLLATTAYRAADAMLRAREQTWPDSPQALRPAA